MISSIHINFAIGADLEISIGNCDCRPSQGHMRGFESGRVSSPSCVHSRR